MVCLDFIKFKESGSLEIGVVPSEKELIESNYDVLSILTSIQTLQFTSFFI